MLAYAFQSLRQTNYEEIATEEFENIQDMFAAILGKGVAQQLKQGLYREYISKIEDLSVLRGKMNFQGTIRNKMQQKRILTCEYDELSEDNLYNQILKATMLILVRQSHVKKESKALLKKNLVFFDNVSDILPINIRWDVIRYQRNNQSYRMLLNICYLVLDGMLLSKEKGETKLASFISDDKMHHLYEKFILEYYRYHHPEYHANPDTIDWYLLDDNRNWLPEMKTDITLKHGNRTFIIDAKYYSKQMKTQFDSSSFNSANLYQIFTYVKNMDYNDTGNVSGMLLYAKTDEEFQPSNSFQMGKNKISVDCLDLNISFDEIALKLDKIAERNLKQED